jgi:hypothetical protein
MPAEHSKKRGRYRPKKEQPQHEAERQNPHHTTCTVCRQNPAPRKKHSWEPEICPECTAFRIRRYLAPDQLPDHGPDKDRHPLPG